MFVDLILRKYSHFVFWTQIEWNMIQVLVALASSVNRYFTLWPRENSVLWGHFALIFNYLVYRVQGSWRAPRYGVTNNPSPQQMQDKGNIPLEASIGDDPWHHLLWLYWIPNSTWSTYEQIEAILAVPTGTLTACSKHQHLPRLTIWR